MRKPNELFAKYFLVNSVVKFMALKKKIHLFECSGK